MTAPTPEKIQRFCFAIDMSQEFCECDMKKEMDGEYVLYTDHLRHLKLAQIAALQRLLDKVSWIPFAYGAEDETLMIEADDLRAEIAALRKELEG